MSRTNSLQSLLLLTAMLLAPGSRASAQPTTDEAGPDARPQWSIALGVGRRETPFCASTGS